MRIEIFIGYEDRLSDLAATHKIRDLATEIIAALARRAGTAVPRISTPNSAGCNPFAYAWSLDLESMGHKVQVQWTGSAASAAM
jgi:hypothetical protein